MATVPPAPPPYRLARRRGYRELIGILAMQSFGNQMAGSFWIVYLVSDPQSLDFEVAILLWVVSFGVAALMVLGMARGQSIRATSSMAIGLGIMVAGHFSFAFLPAPLALAAGGLAFGLYLPLFWLPLNTLIVRETSLSNRAGRLAGMTATFTTVAIIAPTFGGFLAELAGYRVVFALGGVVVAANVILVRMLAQREESVAFKIEPRAVGGRTGLSLSGQGGVDGLLSAATPLGSFLFTTSSLQLGLLFALFSIAAGLAAVLLGRISDRVRARTPFLLLGPLLSVPACLLAFAVRDLSTFALAIGWLSMTASVAPSLIYTILVDRAEHAVPSVTATREFILNASRTVALLGGLGVLLAGGNVYALYLLVGGVILLEVLAR